MYNTVFCLGGGNYIEFVKLPSNRFENAFPVLSTPIFSSSASPKKAPPKASEACFAVYKAPLTPPSNKIQQNIKMPYEYYSLPFSYSVQ
jgi:hypothetical protein